MKKFVAFVGLFAILFAGAGCTPLVVGGAAAGGAYVGYKLRDEGYKISITKEIKGSKTSKSSDNATK